MGTIPHAIWEGSFNLGGTEIKCCTLSDGQRIIEAESLENLFDSMGSDDFVVDQGELQRLNMWQKGIDF